MAGETKEMTKHKVGEVFDYQGNLFTVKGFTHNRQGAINGLYLIGQRGEKEISLSEAKFFKLSKRRGK